MKKFLVAVFASIALACAANAQPIVGIGDFKIGMTQEEFLELPIIKEKTMKNVIERYTPTSAAIPKNTIFKSRRGVKGDKTKDGFPVLYIPDYDRYWFEMEVTDRQSSFLYETIVTFYKDRLILIDIKGGRDFEDILTAKYGKPKLDVINRSEYCVERNTENREREKSEHLKLIWGHGRPIVATHTQKHNFPHCNDITYQYEIKDKRGNDSFEAVRSKAEKEWELERKRVSDEKTKARASSSNL